MHRSTPFAQGSRRAYEPSPRRDERSSYEGRERVAFEQGAEPVFVVDDDQVDKARRSRRGERLAVVYRDELVPGAVGDDGTYAFGDPCFDTEVAIRGAEQDGGGPVVSALEHREHDRAAEGRSDEHVGNELAGV